MLRELLLAAAIAAQGGPSALKAYALRLAPGTDLKPALIAFAKDHDLRAACVLTTVGSLNEAHLRFANRPEATRVPGKLEIVSLVGTFTKDGAHLHLSAADQDGHVWGGHLVDGCPVFTTAEIVVGELPDLSFGRALDPASTFQELTISPR